MAKDKLQFLSPLFLKYQSDFEKNPRSKVFAPLAEAYRKIGMHDKAMEILGSGIRYNPGYVMGYLGMSSCYYDLKQYNMAYTTLRPFVETNRDNLRLQRLFADTCMSLSRKDEALETLKYLLFVNPKDKEVAKLVGFLENEVESRQRTEHKPIVIPPENFMDSNSLEEIKLEDDSIDKIDFEKWLTVDLSKTKNELSEDDNLVKWKMEKETPALRENKNESNKNEEESEVKNSIHTLHLTEKSPDNTPFVTHTLIDLYIGQGHIEKALNILEKILELNPNDKASQNKLLEIKELTGQTSLSQEVKEDEIENLNVGVNELEHLDHFSKISEIPTSSSSEKMDLATLETSEEDGRRNLMNIIEEKFHGDIGFVNNSEEKKQKIILKLSKFLEKIKAKSLDYQI